ncbi:hypothetical protein U5801_28565, partial [Lamprobacter modestohalophilus]|uniref:calcium-binding protein n=1 Tax=Lamprobacter modestohalophilus TaxID=1064514 RepID=UPI002ADEFD9A|nr:hypothetical protein [Lamprobacter modestohalophilus]
DALTGSINASRYDSVNSFVLETGFNPAATSTISSVTSGVTVEINDEAGTNTDILAVAITDAEAAGNNSDELNVKLNDRDAGASSDMGVLSGPGVDFLNIETASLNLDGTAGDTTDYVLGVTAAALDKVTVTGNIALNLDTGLTNTIEEVDASGMTLASKTANGLTVSIATDGTEGVTITGTGGVDDLTGGDGGDAIVGGAGADTITGGKGADNLTGGADSDTFV